MGGAIASTAIVGIERIKSKLDTPEFLPLSGLSGGHLVDYDNIRFFGWDINSSNLFEAARNHGIVERQQLDPIRERLETLRPLPGIDNGSFQQRLQGDHLIPTTSLRDTVNRLKADISRFRAEGACDDIVVVNVTSTERPLSANNHALDSLEGLEFAIDRDEALISPSVLYAYAAISSGAPFANFTPNVATDCAALRELSHRRRVPFAGKDGKTGQTLLKTALAPLFRARALRVDGWYSTNLLGNQDGVALADERAKSSKIESKMNCLDSMLGYHVNSHRVEIHFHPPKGDNKEAWDSIDLSGFLGIRMQIKVNFQCSDSALAAPLVVELARLLQAAKIRGEFGAQEQLSSFFKSPETRDLHLAEHAFFTQHQSLLDWLAE